MLIDQEHLFLFTEDSIRRLLSRVGLPHVAVHRHLFPHDIFLVAGTSPLAETSRQEIDASLLDTPQRRLLLALLDLYGRMKVSTEGLEQQLEVVEADRAARLAVIEEQGQRLGVLAGERNVLQAQLGAVQQQLEVAEADRAARLGVIEEQGQRLGVLQRQLEGVEADRAAQLVVIEEQGQRLGAVAGERNVLQAQLGAVQQQLEGAEADRAAQLGVIEEQGQRLGAVAGEHNVLQAQLGAVQQQLEVVEADRAAQLGVIEEQGQPTGGLGGGAQRTAGPAGQRSSNWRR